MQKIFFVLMTIFLSSCNSDIDKAVNIIDKGISDINAQSTGWQGIVTQISKDLPHEAHDIIGNDIEILAKDVIGATGAETKCNIDFIKARAVQTLQNLKSKLLGLPYKNSPPTFCTLNISSIDLNSDPISRSTLVLYGYDFNTPDTNNKLMQIALVGKKDNILIDESLIGRSTNYQISLNLSALTAELVSNKYNKIQFYWNGDTTNMPQILIQEWKPNVKPDFFQPGPITFVPPHTGGDADFDTEGDNPTIGQIYVQFNIQKTYIDGRVYMDAMEFGGNNTRVGVSINNPNSAWSEWTRLYTLTDNKYEIRELIPNTPSNLSLNINSKGQRVYFQGAGSVKRYTVELDQKGPEAGSYTKVIVEWNALTALLIEKKPTE